MLEIRSGLERVAYCEFGEWNHAIDKLSFFDADSKWCLDALGRVVGIVPWKSDRWSKGHPKNILVIDHIARERHGQYLRVGDGNGCRNRVSDGLFPVRIHSSQSMLHTSDANSIALTALTASASRLSAIVLN